MTIHYMLEKTVSTLQMLQETERKRQRLHFLPALTRELDRATACLDDLLTKRRLWADVYQQPISPASTTLRRTCSKPLKKIADSPDVFTIAEDDLQTFQEDIRSIVDKLNKWKRKLERNLETFCEECSKAVETTRTFLRIPDFFDDDTQRQGIERLLSRILGLLDLEEVAAADVAGLAKEWKTAWNAYQELQSHFSFDTLRQRFNLSEETMSVLERFVSGDALRLSEIPVEVLGELQQIQRFAAQVSLRFEAK